MKLQSDTLRRAMQALEAVCLPNLCTAAPCPVDGGEQLHDIYEWRAPFITWCSLRCMMSKRLFGGVGGFYVDFCEWEVMHGGVPCTRETFERLLIEQGWEIKDGLVAGLMLKETYLQRDYLPGLLCV